MVFNDLLYNRPDTKFEQMLERVEVLVREDIKKETGVELSKNELYALLYVLQIWRVVD